MQGAGPGLGQACQDTVDLSWGLLLLQKEGQKHSQAPWCPGFLVVSCRSSDRRKMASLF